MYIMSPAQHLLPSEDYRHVLAGEVCGSGGVEVDTNQL